MRSKWANKNINKINLQTFIYLHKFKQDNPSWTDSLTLTSFHPKQIVPSIIRSIIYLNLKLTLVDYVGS